MLKQELTFHNFEKMVFSKLGSVSTTMTVIDAHECAIRAELMRSH